ncbi:hypothetical protein G4O51_12385 [Candidatus Bathyarchaeota archaeon A05DMB-2]|jgi:hypothetical protein|nr:hypothetical protein [Candidatus Bathyarchaeota archaeon A05DMB-2]
MKNSANVAAIALAAFLHIFSLWQLDLICVGPVWGYGWTPPQPRYAEQYFQCWLWKTTIGEAYDVLFFVNFLSFWVLFAALWFWHEDGKVSEATTVKAEAKAQQSRLRRLARAGVWLGFAVALAGSFEQALDASASPVWSSVFGFPVPHHYLLGFILLAVSLLTLELKEG